MSDFVRVNQPRVEKMLAMLDTIEKSARSNRVDPAALLAPLRDRLTAAPAARMMPPGVEAPQPKAGASHWSSLIEACRTAPLPDLMDAMMVIATRVQEELDDA